MYVRRPIEVPLFAAARLTLALLAAILFIAGPAAAQVTVATHRYDPARVGANLAEPTLTTANVNVSTFGKLYSYPVDGSVYAQPLYVRGVPVGGAARNVLYVATMNDKLYAFDADSQSATPLWMRDYTAPPSVTPVPITDIGPAGMNIVGNVGIHGTPVIDTANFTMYFVARTKENGSYVQRLHAVDIRTGAEMAGSPVTIAGSVAGTAPDSVQTASGRVVQFNPKMQAQRAALALSNGVVLIAWAGHEDILPYHGWIMGYDARTLAKVTTFCVTPDGSAGGIWQGSRAPTIDAAGNAYFATGNGDWNGTRNFGQSLLKFSVSTSGLTLVDYFTPGNYAALNAADDDLSGSGFTLLPNSNLMVGGGKEGTLYLLDSTNLGHMVPGDPQIPQRIPETGGHVMGGAVYWNSSANGPLVYNWSEDDVLRAYRFSGGRLASEYGAGTVVSPGHPGGSLTVSASASTAGSGIVWASMPTSQDGIHGLVAGVLRAFDAETMKEIWNSEQNPGRDRAGTLMKFVPPLVVSGRVYMPSHDNAVHVYGVQPGDPGDTSKAISIDFVGSNATAMGAAEKAGVVAVSHWNAAPGGTSSTALRLVDAAGLATSATATWSAPNGTWALPTVDQPGDARMMKGYLDTGNTTQVTVTVAGLAQGSYDVYVYADGDNKSYTRSAAYTITAGGSPAVTVELTDAANKNFSGSFIQGNGGAGNFVRFTIQGTGFTLTSTPLTPADGSRRAPVNGIQIVPRPVPQADFSVGVSPASRTITAGSSATYSVTVAPQNGFSGSVSFAASGLPSGASASFSPVTVTGSGTTTMTVTTTSSTTAGTSPFTIAAASGALHHQVTATLTVNPLVATGRAIGVDFVGSGIAMDPSEIAGIVAKPNWNSARGSISDAPLRLVDEQGALTNASISWSSPVGGWALPITDQPGNARMMKGYLDTSSTSSTTVTVAGLAQGGYDVYVYVDGDNRVYDRSAGYTISGAGITTTTIAATDLADTNFSGGFTPANDSPGNVVHFRINGTGFTLTAVPLTPETATRRAPVNGIQILPIAAPPMKAVGIDFTGSAATAMAADETAGVVPQAHWNAAGGAASTTALSLVDAAGAATPVSVTWTANGGWALPITDAPGNTRLMRGYLDTSATSTTTVRVSGLPSGTYDVYVYADGDNKSYTRSATYRISAPGVADVSVDLTDAANTNFSGSFVQAAGTAGNYVRFVVSGASFTLSAIPGPASSTNLRAPINAVQIVPR